MSTGDTTQSITVGSTGFYYVQVFVEHCNDRDTVKLTMEDLIGKYRLTVYNRWGRKLFETDTKQDSWDGKFKFDPVPEGVYYWILDYTSICAPEVSVEDHGTVTLIR